jgi:hypothetical protein
MFQPCQYLLFILQIAYKSHKSTSY